MPFLARHTRPALAGTLLAVAAANSQDKPLAGQAIRDRDACVARGRHVCRAEQSGPSAGQIGQSAHSRAARRTGICGSWTPAETHSSPGATWRSSRSGFRSCTGASNAHVSALPKPGAKTSGFCLMLPVRTSRQPRPMSWPEVTGTLGTSRPGPCGTGGLPPLGGPRQRHWHLACRRDATAMTPGPRLPSPMAIRRACRTSPVRTRIILACRAGTVTNSSEIRSSTSCRATSRIERSVPGRRCYCSRSCCAAPTGRRATKWVITTMASRGRQGTPIADGAERVSWVQAMADLIGAGFGRTVRARRRYQRGPARAAPSGLAPIRRRRHRVRSAAALNANL